jgi:hypothetical protein
MSQHVFPFMRTSLALVTFCFATSGVAWAKKAGHKAHVHGAAQLSFAVEEKSVTVLLESPGDSILGFEHKAESEADKAKVAATVSKIEAEFSKWIALDPALGCTWTKSKIDAQVMGDDSKKASDAAHAYKKSGHKHAEHSEVHVEYAVACQSTLKGAEVKIDLGTPFPRVAKLKVQVLGGSGTAVTLKKGRGSLKL